MGSLPQSTCGRGSEQQMRSWDRQNDQATAQVCQSYMSLPRTRRGERRRHAGSFNHRQKIADELADRSTSVDRIARMLQGSGCMIDGHRPFLELFCNNPQQVIICDPTELIVYLIARDIARFSRAH